MKVPLSLLDNQRDINGIEKKPFGFILVIDYIKKKSDHCGNGEMRSVDLV